MKYFDELKRSMDYLATDPRVVFMGQAVAVPGQVTSAFTLDPSTLPLGERLIVRVDAHDRVARACAAESATCASGPDEACLSRYSWTGEVR